MHKNIQTKSKCDMVVDRIMSMIVNRQLSLGSQLPTENELCEMFGVSRITIRESLKKLEIMGMVSIQQGKGTFVKEINLGTFMQPMFNLIDFGVFDISTIYDARLFIETGTCRLAAQNRDDKDIKVLQSLIKQMDNELEYKDIDNLTELDRRFHIEIANASKNQILKAAVINLENISSACAKRINKQHVVMQESQAHHHKIADAIIKKDADEAERVIIKHTLMSKEFLL